MVAFGRVYFLVVACIALTPTRDRDENKTGLGKGREGKGREGKAHAPVVSEYVDEVRDRHEPHKSPFPRVPQWRRLHVCPERGVIRRPAQRRNEVLESGKK